jgi:predicted acyltransferase
MATSAPASTQSGTPPTTGERLLSLDALRGFDMFFIVGGRELVFALAALFNGGVRPAWMKHQLEHVPWEGFVAYDLIMPLFLFLSGVTIPISAKHWQTQPRSKVYLRILRRVALLWILGMIAQGNLLEFNLARLRLFSNTLQAIAAGYIVAALAELHIPKLKGRLILTVALLIAFWALLTFVPLPGAGQPMLEPKANLALWVDEQILGRFRDGTTYTWILSSLTFAVSVLLGSFAGHLLLDQSREKQRRAVLLTAAGLGCLAAGWLWGLQFPIIKHIWTSSMTLWAAGWSYLLLAAFLWIIDIQGWRRWVPPFVWLGANAITVYMVAHIIPVERWAGKPPFLPPGAWTNLAGAIIVFCGLSLLPCWILYRRRIFLRV